MPIIVLMGVSFSGKTRVGQELAERLGWDFIDERLFFRDVHDRCPDMADMLQDQLVLEPLIRLNAAVKGYLKRSSAVIVASCALLRRYRKLISAGLNNEVFFLHLSVSQAVIENRMDAAGCYVDQQTVSDMLFALEPPDPVHENSATIDANLMLGQVVRAAMQAGPMWKSCPTLQSKREQTLRCIDDGGLSISKRRELFQSATMVQKQPAEDGGSAPAMRSLDAASGAEESLPSEGSLSDNANVASHTDQGIAYDNLLRGCGPEPMSPAYATAAHDQREPVTPVRLLSCSECGREVEIQSDAVLLEHVWTCRMCRPPSFEHDGGALLVCAHCDQEFLAPAGSLDEWVCEGCLEVYPDPSEAGLDDNLSRLTFTIPSCSDTGSGLQAEVGEGDSIFGVASVRFADEQTVASPPYGFSALHVQKTSPSLSAVGLVRTESTASLYGFHPGGCTTPTPTLSPPQKRLSNYGFDELEEALLHMSAVDGRFS